MFTDRASAEAAFASRHYVLRVPDLDNPTLTTTITELIFVRVTPDGNIQCQSNFNVAAHCSTLS
jgi:hypothetical protein